MKLRYFIFIFSLLLSPVYAEYSNYDYISTDLYSDDGARFVVYIGTGLSLFQSDIQNEVGNLTALYYKHKDSDLIITELNYTKQDKDFQKEFTSTGIANIGELSAVKESKGMAFAYSFGVGFTLPHNQQYRLMLSLDKISEIEYNSTPLFRGNVNIGGKLYEIESGSTESYLDTNLIGFTFIYDFFKDIQKPVGQIIPYVGLGIGYADVKTTMQLVDLYGDLSLNPELMNFGSEKNGILTFNKSEKITETVSGLATLGFSYGVSERMFIDLGFKMIYIPKVHFALVDKDAKRSKNWFSANNIFHNNISFGIRFEF